MTRREIYSSKTKSFYLLIGSAAFVALGIKLVLDAEMFAGERGIPFVTRGIGIVSILFFGLGVFVGIKRLIRSEIALIVDNEGINLNPRKSLTEFVKWADIRGFDEIKINRTRFVIINVKNPQYWIDRETSAFRKKLMQFNIDRFNSPFNIAAAGLDISSDELINTLNSSFDEYTKQAGASA